MNKSIRTYILVTYLITWGIIIPSYLMYRSGAISLAQLNMVYNLGALGPFLGGLVSAYGFYGRKGINTLFSGFRIKGMDVKAVVICLSPLLLFCIGLLCYPLFTGHWYTFEDTKRQFELNTPLDYINWLLPFITYSIFEEFGWRGFLLPQLQSRYTAFTSSLILAFIWATWHLPFFLWRFQFGLFISLGFFFAIAVGSIIITSLYNQSKGSIAAIILFHFCNNMSSALDKEFIVVVVSMGFILLAMLLLRKYGRVDLSGNPRVKNIYHR